MFSALVSVLTTLLVYLSLLLVSLWIWFHWSHRHLLRAAAKVPVTIPTVPLLGHAYLTFRSFEDTTTRLLEMTVDGVMKGIKTTCFWVGPLPIIGVGDIDDVQILLNGKNIGDKPEEYDFFLAGLDSGVGPFRSHLLSAQGEIWKVTRKHMNPMFHPQNVQHMIPVFNVNSRELVARMRKHVGEGPVNMMEYLMDVSLKTVCNLIHGHNVHIDVESESFKGLMIVVLQVPELFVKRLLYPWLRVGWLFQLFYRSQVKQIDANWKNFTEPLLQMTREKGTQKIHKENRHESKKVLSSDKYPGLLNMLDAYSHLQQRYPEFTEADMRCEMLGFYCTGTGTVGSGTASCLLALAQYQDIQERLYQEIVAVVGYQDDVTHEDLARMPYLDQVIKETLRIFLIIPYVLRKVYKDVKLSACTLPAGTTVACSIAAIHMNPEIYPNPYKFDPDRFLPGKEKFQFFPFSGGPRICIAKIYAMDLMKIQIIHVLRNFRLTTNQDIHNLKKKMIAALMSTEGYNIRVKKRILDDKVVGSD